MLRAGWERAGLALEAVEPGVAVHGPADGGCHGIRQTLEGSFEGLYRSQILQVNMRLKALAEIYTMHSFAQLCNLIFLSKFCHFFCKILQN